MRRYAFRLAMLALAVLGPSVVRADDQEIAQQIVEKLQAEKQAGNLKGFSIDLQVEEGTVWLSGRVANEFQQAKALDIARRVAGVQQVVNDLSVVDRSAVPTVKPAVATNEIPAHNVSTPIGSGVSPQAAGQPTPARVASAQPVAQSGMPAQLPPGYGYGYGPPTPVYAGTRSQVPLAFAPARQAGYEAAGPFHHGHHGHNPGYAMPAEPMAENVVPNAGPVPMHVGGGMGVAPARYDHPQMPCYAWPSYAAHPNYAAVTYPKQYSPTAWPYIGPFYPYPQVPLGWRKVTLEWDDGWWMLDFKERRSMYNH